MSKKVKKKGLKQKQLLAAHLMARGLSGGSIADRLEIRQETLSRWKRQPSFMRVREAAMQEMRESLQHRLFGLAEEAMKAIESELGHYASFDGKRVEAGLNVLKFLGISREAMPADFLLPHQEENVASKVRLSAASTSVIEAETPSALSDVTP